MFGIKVQTFEEYFYRIEDKTYAGCAYGEFDEYGPPLHCPELRKFGVLKHTKCGVWITVPEKIENGNPEGKRFVRNDTKKKFACASIVEAKESFIARKNMQMGYLRGKIENIKECIAKLYQIKDSE